MEKVAAMVCQVFAFNDGLTLRFDKERTQDVMNSSKNGKKRVWLQINKNTPNILVCSVGWGRPADFKYFAKERVSKAALTYTDAGKHQSIQ